jgi:hypothetical protein
LEHNRSGETEKLQKLIAELEVAQSQLSEVESRAIAAAKNASTAESQLAELQVSLLLSLITLEASISLLYQKDPLKIEVSGCGMRL